MKDMSGRSSMKAATFSLTAWLLQTRASKASPLSLPVGLELNTVSHEMDTGPLATLKALAGIEYNQVEMSPLAKTPAKDSQKMLDDLGRKNPSGHYQLRDLIVKLDEILELAYLFAQKFVVVCVPWVADASRFKPDSQKGPVGFFLAVIDGLTLVTGSGMRSSSIELANL